MNESEIRSAINAYSQETSGHPFYNYGNDVDITVNDDCPIYECLIQTQYEERNSEEKRRPYKGWALATRKYFSLSEVDPWSFRLKLPDDFIDRKTVIEVEGSAGVATCGSCNGKGHNTCHTCLGKGKNVCPTCHGDWQHLECGRCGGRGEVSCPDCGGKGEHRCERCNGTGHITEMVNEWRTHYDYGLQKDVSRYEQVAKTRSCPNCNGSGRWRCSSCGGSGKRVCTRCGGSGYVTCTDCSKGYIICKTCGGKGTLVCQVCEGEGRNEIRYIVNRTLSQNTVRSYVCDKRVREFAESYDLSYTDVDFNVRGKSLEGELYPEDVRCSSKLSKLLSKTESDNGVILFQKAVVQHVASTYVEYRYDGSNYGGIVCGGVFYPDGSPIDEWSSNLVEKAEKKLRRGSSAKAMKMLEQAESAGADTGVTGDLLAKARQRLGNLQDAGVSVAFWLVMLGLSPVLYNFYSKLNPVASWAIVTNNPDWSFFGFVPFCQTFIFVVAAFLLRAYLNKPAVTEDEKEYSSIWVYFAKGFFGYLLAAMGLLAALLFVNYLGLSILSTFVIGLFIIAVALVVGIAGLIIRWIIQLF